MVLHGFGRRVGYTALAGPAGPVALVAAQARLVLYLAAAYGRDPRRVVEPRLAAPKTLRVYPCVHLTDSVVHRRVPMQKPEVVGGRPRV